MTEETRTPIVVVCRHENPPRAHHPEYACDGDEPVYEGDIVVTRTKWVTRDSVTTADRQHGLRQQVLAEQKQRRS